MINFIKQPFDVDSPYAYDEMSKKFDDKIEKQNKISLYKMKGQPLFLFSRNLNIIQLKYYQSYKNDMCDTMYEGELKKGLEGCQLIGNIKKPRAIWAICIGIVCTLLIDLLVISFFITFYEDFDILNHLVLWFTLIAARAIMIVHLLRFDRKRAKLVKEEITKFMQTERKNEDDKRN